MLNFVKFDTKILFYKAVMNNLTDPENKRFRTGVYICECGPNLIEAMDIDYLVDVSSKLDSVVAAKAFNLLCSDQGQKFLTSEIIDNKLDRIVIAACSPREHEKTFMAVLKEANLNPWFLQIVNLREQVAWITPDRDLATEKAESFIKGAVKRVREHTPLEEKYIDCNTDVLVVGGGISGISAALALAQEYRKVYLVEKSPVLGGHAIIYEDWFPGTSCASCEISPLLDSVINNANIKILLMSEVQSVLGYYGNYTVTVRKKARYIDEDKCLGCGACVDACPVSVPDEYNMGLNNRKAVFIPYEGSLPNIFTIDSNYCEGMNKGGCTACRDICPFEAVDYDQADELIEIDAGAVVLATGFDLYDPAGAPQYKYKEVPEIYTAIEFERLINQSGPTHGVPLMKNGRSPDNVTFIHCVGSRSSGTHAHCSGVCCAYMLKYILYLHEKYPDIKTEQVYVDFCLPGKELNNLLIKAQKISGHNFHRMSAPGNLNIQDGDGEISVYYLNENSEQTGIKTDMVVLAPAILGSERSARLGELFDIESDRDGFWSRPFITSSPVRTRREGVFTAGCSQEPMDIPGAILSGQAAASCVLKELVPGKKLPVEPMAVTVDSDMCSGCKACLKACEFGAIVYDEELHQVAVNPLLCRACGICIVTCPCRAIKIPFFSNEAIISEISGLLEKGGVNKNG